MPFYHLNTWKSRILRKWKNCCRRHHFTPVYQKPQLYEQDDHGGWKSWKSYKNGGFEKLGRKSWKTSTLFGVESWKSWSFYNVQLRFWYCFLEFRHSVVLLYLDFVVSFFVIYLCCISIFFVLRVVISVKVKSLTWWVEFCS